MEGKLRNQKERDHTNSNPSLNKKSQLHRIMKTKNSIVCCLIALLALPVLGAFAETPAAFSVQLITTFDYPGSGNSSVPPSSIPTIQVAERKAWASIIHDWSAVITSMRRAFYTGIS